jgi:hypothetical protein
VTLEPYIAEYDASNCRKDEVASIKKGVIEPAGSPVVGKIRISPQLKAEGHKSERLQRNSWNTEIEKSSSRNIAKGAAIFRLGFRVRVCHSPSFNEHEQLVKISAYLRKNIPERRSIGQALR